MEKTVKIKLASDVDEKRIMSVLSTSFPHDRYMTYLLEPSKNPDKLNILIRYIIQQTLAKGKAYITESASATALWLTHRKEKFTWKFIQRNVNIYRQLGRKCIERMLKMERISHKEFPSNSPFMYLYMIGVTPECRGRGYASALLDSALAEADDKNLAVFLETANEQNVAIYEKKGFSTTRTFQDGEFTVYYMSRNSSVKNQKQ